MDRFNKAVHIAERQVEVLRGNYERKVTEELIQMRYGQSINFASLGSEAKRDLRMHVRLTNLKRFYNARRGDFDVVTPEYLYARAEKAAVMLDELRKYIAEDQATSSTSK